MPLLSTNQKNLTFVYMISIVTQIIGFGVIAGTSKINWLFVPILLIAALIYTISYYKLFSD